MKKEPTKNPEKAYEIIKSYVERGLVIDQYSVPSECQHIETQHTRPKGQPMLSGGFWVSGFGGE